METLTTCLESIGNFHNFFGINWKHSQLAWNEVETFHDLFAMKWKHSQLFGVKWKHSQLVSNEMEIFTTSLE